MKQIASIELMNITKQYWKSNPLNNYSIATKEKEFFKENIGYLLEAFYKENKIHKILEKTLREVFENSSFEECKNWFLYISQKIPQILGNNSLFAVLIILKNIVLIFILNLFLNFYSVQSI